LLKALLDRGIEPQLQRRAEDLLVEDGRVSGVELAGGQGVRAQCGVILATGGFEWAPDLVRQFLRGPMTSPASLPHNSGDGLLMLMRAGASLGNMSEAWWVPTLQAPGDVAFGHQRAHLVLRERTLPRSIMVNSDGRRFANEASNYNAFAGALHQLDPTRFDYVNLPCWLIFDQGFLDEYGFHTAAAGDPAPDWVTGSDSISGLAELIGTPPAALEATISRWNALVAAGDDADFGRGRSAYDRPERWSDEWRQLCRAAGVSPVTLHTARHSSVTAMRAAGVADDVVAKWHGHDETIMRRTYTHPDTDALAAAGQALADVLGGKAAPMA
jgi:hypothetical protein